MTKHQTQHIYSKNTIRAFLAKHCAHLSKLQLAVADRAWFAVVSGSMGAPSEIELYASESNQRSTLLRLYRIDGALVVVHTTATRTMLNQRYDRFAVYYDCPGIGWQLLCWPEEVE